FDVSSPIRKDEVVRKCFVVRKEVFLDDLGFVAEAENELVVPPSRIPLHDVPQDRPTADRDHWLRDLLRLLAHADAQAAAEDDDLHSWTATANHLLTPSLLI